ncbi:cleavage/polyadenylation specificity factor [Tanacetum coccineum]
MGTQSLLPRCSWKGHLRGVHIHYCPGVLGGDTCEGYIFITARVFLEGTPVMGTYGFHYCPGVLGGDTYDGYIEHRFHELRVIPMLDVPIYGKIAILELFCPHDGETQDLLFIATEIYKFCVLQWDVDANEVPWTNEHPLENRELNAVIGAW